MNEVVAGASWFAVNRSLVFTAISFSGQVFRFDQLAACLVHTIVPAWALVAGWEIMLGAMALPSPGRLMALVSITCLVALLVLHVLRRHGGQLLIYPGVLLFQSRDAFYRLEQIVLPCRQPLRKKLAMRTEDSLMPSSTAGKCAS
ncbi:hypothetical protein [Thermogutta sp.]|jgi:hypothetical protein|uniref:hypothetical protein n=1 Tax=Thermogutta sp. TaxID=1962930 RepID=UPI003C7B9479